MRNTLLLAGSAVAVLVAGVALADGWELRNGHFPEGKVTVIDLSPEQAKRLDYIHKCQRDNTRTPYLFHLSAQQARLLKRQARVTATRFAPFDSSAGVKNVDLETNVLIRFAPLKAEIPHRLLSSDSEARKYELKVMGWLSNPIERATASQVASRKCPG